MINIGKVKKGTRTIKFGWGDSDFSNKNFIPSSTTLIISKNFIKRRSLIENITCNDDSSYEIIQLTNFSIDDLVTELKKYKDLIEERLVTKDIDKKYILCLDDYDLLLYKDTVSQVKTIKEYVNYINDYGVRVNIFLLLGCASISEKFIDNISNIILLPPYNIYYLNYLFSNSIYSIINSTNPIGQFQTVNGVTIDQVENEPTILKNGNNIYPYFM